MIRLQIALDGTLESALSVLDVVHPYIDIAEIGTPLIYREGMNALRTIEDRFPEISLLADLKIMDAGEEEAAIAYEAGATYVTVLGVTQDATIEGALRSARHYDREIMIDMMQVDDVLGRGRHLVDMGCDLLCVHTAFDVQDQHESPYQQLELLREHIDSQYLAIAGGINLGNLGTILPLTPSVIVVGGAIARADDPAGMAKQIREEIDQYADHKRTN